jgi:hypothetical protein
MRGQRAGAAGFNRRNASTQPGSKKAVDQKETLRSAEPHTRRHLAWRLCNERSAYLKGESGVDVGLSDARLNK